jgi:predicted Zn-dependent protease
LIRWPHLGNPSWIPIPSPSFASNDMLAVTHFDKVAPLHCPAQQGGFPPIAPTRRSLAWVCLLLVAMSVCGCRSAPVTGRKQFVIIPESQEIEQGAAAFQDIRSKEGDASSSPAAELVKRVGNRIAAVAKRDDYQWEFQLLKGETLNAFCLPGGKVAVYEGILPVCQTEAGLAVVMSHEVAHALARHGGERMSQSAAVDSLRQVVAMAASKQTELKQQIFMQAYGLSTQYGVLLPYSRQHELEADQIGLMLMAEAGYDPTEAPRFWERFGQVGGGQGVEFLSTHPSDGRRQQRLVDLLPEAQQIYARCENKIGMGEPLPLSTPTTSGSGSAELMSLSPTGAPQTSFAPPATNSPFVAPPTIR